MSSPLAQPRLRVPVRLFVEHEAWRRTHEWHAKDRRGRDVGADWLKAELDAAKLILFFAVGEEILRGEREAWLRPKMVRYRILAPVTFDSGVLTLTGQQAESRAHRLESLGRGRYQIIAPVQFKAGEVVEYDGALGRGAPIEPVEIPSYELVPADHWLIGGLRTWLLAEGGPKLPEHCPWISELYILGGAPVAAQSDNRGAHFSRDREATLSAALWELAYNRAEVLNGQGKVIAAKLAGRVNDNRVTHGFDFDGAPQPSTILSTIQQALSTKRKE